MSFARLALVSTGSATPTAIVPRFLPRVIALIRACSWLPARLNFRRERAVPGVPALSTVWRTPPTLATSCLRARAPPTASGEAACISASIVSSRQVTACTPPTCRCEHTPATHESSVQSSPSSQASGAPTVHSGSVEEVDELVVLLGRLDVELLDVLVDVLEDAEVLDEVDVLVVVGIEVEVEVDVLVVTPGQLLKSMVQPGVHTSEPPVGHVCPPKSVPSHSSPGSRTPLPHNGIVLDVLVEVVLVEVVLVVVVGGGTQGPRSTFRVDTGGGEKTAPVSTGRVPALWYSI